MVAFMQSRIARDGWSIWALSLALKASRSRARTLYKCCWALSSWFWLIVVYHFLLLHFIFCSWRNLLLKHFSRLGSGHRKYDRLLNWFRFFYLLINLFTLGLLFMFLDLVILRRYWRFRRYILLPIWII